MSELRFFKSSHRAANGSCVEVAFRESSYSAGHGECVEVADLPACTAVRDSQNPHQGHLDIPRTEWAAFLDTARR